MKTKNAGLLYIFESRLLYLPRPPSVHSAFLVFCSSRFSEYHTLSAAYCPPYDEQRDFVWTKGELRSDGYVYGVKEADGMYHYELRYNPAPDVIRWVEEMDRNYILQLKREGKLLEKEPIGDQEIKAAEDTPADKDGWGHRHQFHDEIFAAFADAREEVKQFGKELSEKERQGALGAGAGPAPRVDHALGTDGIARISFSISYQELALVQPKIGGGGFGDVGTKAGGGLCGRVVDSDTDRRKRRNGGKRRTRGDGGVGQGGAG